MTAVQRPPVAPVGVLPSARTRNRHAAAAGGAVIVLLVVLVVALRAGGGTEGVAVDPLVGAGLPVARLAGRIAALGTVGALVFAAVLLPAPGFLPQASRRAMRAASAWATAWAAATTISAVLTLAQVVGGSPDVAAVQTFVLDLPAGRATVVVLAVAVVVAGVARRCTTPAHAGALLLLAVTGLLVPVVLTGHSSTAEDHVLAVTTLGVHVVAASIWVGGLLALLLHGRGRDDMAPAASRFSAVALLCFLATGLSGVLAAWLLLGRDAAGLVAALGTGYGGLLATKTAALVVLGVLGWAHRRRALPRLRAGEPGSFVRLAVVEGAVMLATVALAVGLAASPPPGAAADALPGPAASEVKDTAPATGADDMAGHDHGELSVGVLIDESRFHVAGPVDAGSRVTVHNATPNEVSITAADGSFDVVVPGFTLMTFAAPAEPGSYPFASRHSPSFTDVLVVE